jgi:hypothetical protein
LDPILITIDIRTRSSGRARKRRTLLPFTDPLSFRLVSRYTSYETPSNCARRTPSRLLYNSPAPFPTRAPHLSVRWCLQLKLSRRSSRHCSMKNVLPVTSRSELLLACSRPSAWRYVPIIVNILTGVARIGWLWNPQELGVLDCVSGY